MSAFNRPLFGFQVAPLRFLVDVRVQPSNIIAAWVNDVKERFNVPLAGPLKKTAGVRSGERFRGLTSHPRTRYTLIPVGCRLSERVVVRQHLVFPVNGRPKEFPQAKGGQLLAIPTSADLESLGTSAGDVGNDVARMSPYDRGFRRRGDVSTWSNSMIQAANSCRGICRTSRYRRAAHGYRLHLGPPRCDTGALSTGERTSVTCINLRCPARLDGQVYITTDRDSGLVRRQGALS